MQKLAIKLFRCMGWRIVGALPAENKYLIIVAPHTSNWDFIIGLIARFCVGVKIHFLVKSQAFFFPLSIFLRAVGGVPVDRSKKNNTVAQAVTFFEKNERFVLAITPEGTRSAVTRWKQGFYHIACKASVPIVTIGIDYATKEIRIGTVFYPSGDLEQDGVRIIEFFRAIKGRYPKNIPDSLS